MTNGSQDEPASTRREGRASAVLLGLSLLYAAQGVPFGFATEYLPVVLRLAGYTRAQIALLGWLQLPWQLKVLWAHAADGPVGRRHSRSILLGLQLLLALGVSAFALRPLAADPPFWFVLTAVAALLAATQDVFVDALAVRTLAPWERGLGNTAQVAGYRLGILGGGAGLLLLVGPFGEAWAIRVCALGIALASVGAFLLGRPAGAAPGPSEGAGAAGAHGPAGEARLGLMKILRHLMGPERWPVLVLALTYKLGLHMASVLIKPMVVDAGWSERQIGLAVVSAGITAALVGSVLGGVAHRALGEVRALALAGVLQALVCVPLVIAERAGVPLGWTTVAIAAENFASGLGTTVLFAALMSATRPADAGLHYTLLTSANALAIGLGGLLGGTLADVIGAGRVFGLSALVSALPLALLGRWRRAAAASARA
ncbi:MAG TPA: MFS transporter [Polyangia bacterium]|nr:MFS transporter [Polyangia bacterium]